MIIKDTAAKICFLNYITSWPYHVIWPI